MQYVMKKVLGRVQGPSQKWTEVDVSECTIRALFSQYFDLYIQLEHPTFEGNCRYTTLADLRSTIEDDEQTLDEFFEELGTTSITHHAGSIQLESNVILSKDLWDAGFNVQLTDMSKHPETDLPNGHKKDLLITKDIVDYEDLYQHTLVNLNGLFYRTSGSEYGLHVVDGVYSMRQANKVMGSITSFENVGKLEIVDLTDDMIYRPKPDNNLYEQTYLDIGVSTENKTVLLVIGGYLHALDETYKGIGDGLVKIDFNRIPLIQRHLESDGLLDQSSLNIDYQGEFKHFETDAILRSDDYIKALLNLSQSFAVIIDTPYAFVERQMLEASKLPGVYYSVKKPLTLLTTLRGKCLPYKFYDGQNKWVLNTDSNLKPNYVFETMDFEIQESIASNLYPAKPYNFDKGYLMTIGMTNVAITDS